jgi:Cof subfamily protein (haloacid dehalogenase superfamily)
MPSHPDFDLVVLDLDGTILSETGIAPAIFDAVAAVQAAGVPVTIATGRTLDDTRRRAKGLPIRLPMVATQGAVVGEFTTGRILHEAAMSLESARRVAAWADASEETVFLYFTQPDGSTRLVQNRAVWSDAEYDHLFGIGREVSPCLGDLLRGEHAQPPLKFVAVNDPTLVPDMVPDLTQRFAPDLYIARTHSVLVEGTDAAVNKGSGLARLLEMLGIDPRRVLAIGDSDNDLPVLSMVGTPIVMGQAKAHIKAAAHWIAPALAEDGAAVALRRFVLGEV